MVDLDGFKSINDKLGHPEGDRILQYSAFALRRLTREGDKVFRLGGDEFAILLPIYQPGAGREVPTGLDFAATLKERFMEEIGLIINKRYRAALMMQNLAVEDDDISALNMLGASFGVVVQKGDGINYIQMLDVADKLMYDMKAQNKNKR
jgi:GGDEF domain-containing protein